MGEEGNNIIETHGSDNYVEKQSLYPIEALKVEKAFYSVFELKRKADKKIIKLDSDFQRDNVWKRKQQIELIESVLMGLPLPIFYFNRNKEGNLIVVDGRQRLTALFLYMDDAFPLGGLKILSKRFEKKFSKLDQIYQAKIEDYQILAYEIMPETPESVLFNIFDRVNRGGTPLNRQEIRNALYQGQATRFLNECYKTNSFLSVTDKGLVNDKRMKARYIVLRFIAFFLLKKDILRDNQGNIYEYKSLDDLLSTTLKYLNNLSSDAFNLIRGKFYYALNNCSTYLNKDVFRLNKNGRRTAINMNIFETIMYIMAIIPDDLDRKAVSNLIEELKLNNQFLDSIGSHRDNLVKVNMRFDMADNLIKELVK